MLTLRTRYTPSRYLASAGTPVSYAWDGHSYFLDWCLVWHCTHHSRTSGIRIGCQSCQTSACMEVHFLHSHWNASLHGPTSQNGAPVGFGGSFQSPRSTFMTGSVWQIPIGNMTHQRAPFGFFSVPLQSAYYWCCRVCREPVRSPHSHSLGQPGAHGPAGLPGCHPEADASTKQPLCDWLACMCVCLCTCVRVLSWDLDQRPTDKGKEKCMPVGDHDGILTP